MKVIVTGSRYWCDPEAVWIPLTGLLVRAGHLRVVHGDCRDRKGCPAGADRFATEWVEDAARQGYDVELEKWPADWPKLGRAAGPIRNEAMVQAGVWCDKCRIEGMVLAWPLGPSRGTYGCMQLAGDAGIEVRNCADQAERRLAFDT